MGPHIPIGKLVYRLLAVVGFSLFATQQTQAFPASGCTVSSVHAQVRAEGLTERMGDIILQCSGAPGAVSSGNLTVNFPVNVTNRVDAANQSREADLAVDLGSGFVPTGIPGTVLDRSITFFGVSLTVPPGGSFNIRISNIRINANQSGVVGPQSIAASLSVSNPVFLPVDRAQVPVAVPSAGLFIRLQDTGITCTGSPLPDTFSLATLFAAKTAFASTRLTEGFGTAFLPRTGVEDNGTRFLVNYSDFPATARIFIPDLVAGSSALEPTSGGDMGLPQSGGRYVPGSGTLLLVRVFGADANGAGGSPRPVPAGPGPVALNAVSEVALSGGAGFAVYEVADASAAQLENAQFPTFIGLPKNSPPAVARETASLAPVSTVTTASATAPIQRFARVTPASDCSVMPDCQSSFFPRLSIQGNPVELTSVGDNQTGDVGAVRVRNAGGGVMRWAASIDYLQGSDWLLLDNTSGVNNGGFFIWALPKGLAPGTYHANITVDAGFAGSQVVPATLTAKAAPPPPPAPTPPPAAPLVTVTQVVNAATFAVTPMVAGSLGTAMGSHLSGKNVSVVFDGHPANLLYVGDNQINLQVPVELGAQTSATMVVTVDGASSVPVTVSLAAAWPSIFANGVLNQDNSLNASASGAPAESVLQIFATGIPAGAVVSVAIAGQTDLAPLYAGPAPEVPGVQQVNVRVPAGLASGPVQLTICATAGGQQFCSAGYTLNVQ
ncbi:MAG: hypothetical protein LAP87_02780 [Acidobacteriia bacterium]|nr:hypothetical protein [Terriglobia bacterium]